MNTIHYEYIERARMATDFDQRSLRNKIRDHVKFIEGFKNFPNRIRCVTELSALGDDELIAYDEYLNCIINGWAFHAILSKSVRFSETL